MLTKFFYKQSYAHLYTFILSTLELVMHTYAHKCAQSNVNIYSYVNKNITKMCITPVFVQK